MKNKHIKHVKNIDIDKIDFDSYCESLLSGVTKIKEKCECIDTQIDRISTISFIPWFSTMKHYDVVIERMAIKNELLRVYKSFIKWFKGLNKMQKKLYVAYFIKQDYKLCNDIGHAHYYEKFILPMSKNFMKYITLISNFNEEELIENPFIYESYVFTLRKNKKRKKRGFGLEKERKAYDS